MPEIIHLTNVYVHDYPHNEQSASFFIPTLHPFVLVISLQILTFRKYIPILAVRMRIQFKNVIEDISLTLIK